MRWNCFKLEPDDGLSVPSWKGASEVKTTGAFRMCPEPDKRPAFKNISWSLWPSSVSHHHWWKPDGWKCFVCCQTNGRLWLFPLVIVFLQSGARKPRGQMDKRHFKSQMLSIRHDNLLSDSFSAAWNITGLFAILWGQRDDGRRRSCDKGNK